MRVHVFAAPENRYGFSRDMIGANLPGHDGPWRHVRTIEIYPDRLNSPLTGVDENEIVYGLLKQGYYVTGANIVWDNN